ncbi:MAG: hypothetical protein HRT35_25735 [Algicola sp.]|nr:hypothetical protein [Algicola sp.]
MKPFKMLTPASALLTTGVLGTTAVIANTYTTTIAIDYQTNTLNWTQKTPMQFATVVFNKKTANGQICHTHSNKKSNNTLCPGSRGGVKNSDYTITGTPNTTVLVNLNTSKTTVEGIEFTPILIGDNSIKLNKKGKANYDIGGQLLLIDGAATSSTSLTFSFELEFVSQ